MVFMKLVITHNNDTITLEGSAILKHPLAVRALHCIVLLHLTGLGLAPYSNSFSYINATVMLCTLDPEILTYPSRLLYYKAAKLAASSTTTIERNIIGYLNECRNIGGHLSSLLKPEYHNNRLSTLKSIWLITKPLFDRINDKGNQTVTFCMYSADS